MNWLNKEKKMSGIEIAHEVLLENLKIKFGSIPKEIEQRIETVENTDLLKNLLHEILTSRTIEEFKDTLFKFKIPSAKSGLVFRQNYDAVVKWMGEQFKGKTLEIFGIKTEPIVELFNFEPVNIRIDTGRIDLMFRDKGGALYHLEEQRNMTIKDLHRFSIYHFQAAEKWIKTKITDIILMSGNTYNGDKFIETGTGTYKPLIIDLTQRDGRKRLHEIKEEINAEIYDNLIELVFLPLYGKEKKEERSRMAVEVLDYEIELLKKNKLQDKLVIATIIMSNKIVDKKMLKQLYEEVKNMLDILEIARDDGMEIGIQKGMQQGMQQGIQKGRIDGMQKGAQNKALEMARAFKQRGVDIGIIADSSGLPIEQVKQL